MTGFHAWILSNAPDARRVEAVVAAVVERAQHVIDDGALMSWPSTRRQPKVRPLENVPSRGVLGDAFWGWYFGELFIAPQLLVTAQNASELYPTEQGTARRSIRAGLTGLGLPAAFNRAVVDGLVPGGVAFVVLCDAAVGDRIDAVLAEDYAPVRLQTVLTVEQLAALRAVFDR